MAVQLGVHAGATVYATVSSKEKGMIVEALGGTPVFYRDTDVDEYVADATKGQGFDVVFDTVGGPTLDVSFAATRPGGQVVSTVSRSTHDLSVMHAKGLSLHVVFMLLPLITGCGRPVYGQILKEVARLVDEDLLAVLIDEHRFNCTEIAEAHRYWQGGSALGKISVKVSD